MEFNEKLQDLRKQKELTQEELAEALYVSRTAISKWESGRGYPSIDSLKVIAQFFSVSVDELLSSKELVTVAEKDNMQKTQNIRDLVFGLLDCSVAMLLFLPFFGQHVGGVIYEISLLSLTGDQWYTQAAYIAIVALTIIWGIATLALQNYQKALWIKLKCTVSILLSMFASLVFIATLQPYAAILMFVFLVIKGILLIKRQ